MGHALAATLLMSALAGGGDGAFGNPEGRWIVHPPRGFPGGIVTIFQEDGEYLARVEEILPPGNPSMRCTSCKGPRHGEPVVGMVIGWGFVEDKPGKWKSGRLLHPANGRVYHAKAEMMAGGQRMKLRAYWGIPLFGRTLHLSRAD